MAKPEEFFVRLDHSLNYAGRPLAGTVHLTLEEPLRACKITVLLVGRAWVSWEEREKIEGTRNGFENVSFSDEEIYFQEIIHLWGDREPPRRDSKSSFTELSNFPMIAKGHHAFRFQYKTPHTCPTSFEGELGYIRFMCIARVHLPEEDDWLTELPFSLVGIQDLNVDPYAARGLKESKTETGGSTCCPIGSISCELELPRQGYVPGEMIPIHAKIFNRTLRAIKRIEARVIQYCVYKAKKDVPKGYIKRRKTLRTVASLIKTENKPSGEVLEWNGTDDVSLKLPPCPPMLLHCFIIDINYELQFQIFRTGPSNVLELTMPITIGTLPLKENFELIRKTSTRTPKTANADQQMMSMDGFKLTYPGLPEPVVGSCIFGEIDLLTKETKNSSRTSGPRKFTPQYAFYGQIMESGSEKDVIGATAI